MTDILTDSRIVEHLIEAQRGLMGALMQITCAIEEVNTDRPANIEKPGRMETANLAIAKALESNTDFTLYARRASEALLARISPAPDELGDSF
jgi:hypothetical protein